MSPIICLCGSTKFKDEFIRINGFFLHTDKRELTRKEKAELDVLHMAKIDLADLVHIINIGGYIGESTEREIAYAKMRNKTITYERPLLDG